MQQSIYDRKIRYSRRMGDFKEKGLDYMPLSFNNPLIKQLCAQW